MNRNFNSIILINDDFHASLIFINGHKVGCLDDELNTLIRFYEYALDKGENLEIESTIINL